MSKFNALRLTSKTTGSLLASFDTIQAVAQEQANWESRRGQKPTPKDVKAKLTEYENWLFGKSKKRIQLSSEDKRLLATLTGPARAAWKRALGRVNHQVQDWNSNSVVRQQRRVHEIDGKHVTIVSDVMVDKRWNPERQSAR